MHSKIYLKQTISNKSHQELMSVPLSHQRGVFRCIHGGKIKHCYIWLAIMINCKIQGRQLVVGCKVSSFSGVGQQIALVHIFPTEKQLSINRVLQGEKDVGWETPMSSLNWNTAASQQDWEPHISQQQETSDTCHLQKASAQAQVLPQTETLLAHTERAALFAIENYSSSQFLGDVIFSEHYFPHIKRCHPHHCNAFLHTCTPHLKPQESRSPDAVTWGAQPQGLTRHLSNNTTLKPGLQQFSVQFWARFLLGESGKGPCLYRSSYLKAVIINEAGSISSLIVDETPNHRWYHKTAISPVAPDTLGWLIFFFPLRAE